VESAQVGKSTDYFSNNMIMFVEDFNNEGDDTLDQGENLDVID